MVIQRGIEINLDKIQDIMEMTPPKNIKEVQSLNGKIAALNRFSVKGNRQMPTFLSHIEEVL